MTLLNRFLVIDVETTGNNPFNDSIIQLGAVLIEDLEIKNVYSSFVYTEKKIPKIIQELTGISMDMVKDAPTLDEVMIELLPLLEGASFVAHNATFDLGFIQHALDELGYSPFSGLIIDTVELSRILLPTAQSYKLQQLAEALHISHENPHRADDDAKATAETFILLVQHLMKMPLVYLQRLAEMTKYSHKDMNIFIESILSNQYVGHNDDDVYTFFNQIALQPMEQEIEQASYQMEEQEFEMLFDENGLLFHQFPGFELRTAQKEMSSEVMEAFKHQEHLMVEAGTGTGKSLAYLIPALLWSKQHDEKVVISTHTINLQEQLFQRDIPLLKKILPFDFSATILKGRNNYLCLRKFEQLLLQNQMDASSEDTINLAQILTWVAQTKTGDVEEINFSTSGRVLWEQVKSDAETCLNRKCPWFRTCFYHRAKQKAQMADIIITNHSLLLTNLKAEHRILPAFQRLIIDEAHQLEEVALKHLGFEINQYQFHAVLQRLYKDAKNGFLIKIINELKHSQNADQISIANQLMNDVIPLISKIDLVGQTYFDSLGEFVDQLAHYQDTGRKTIRITENVTQREMWGHLQAYVDNMYILFTELMNGLDEALQKLKNIEVDETIIVDLNGFLKDVRDLIFHFSEWNHANDTNMVFWVETLKRKKRTSVFLYAAPVEIGPFIREFLFDKLDSVILTSATLSVNESFDYACHEFGFEPDEKGLKRIKLDSPFNYKEQSVVYIPKDVPDIREVSENEYIDHLAENIADIAVTFNGRTLILFTSHKMLQSTYWLVKEMLEPFHIKVLGHGIDSNSRSKLINRFISESNTILLGTNSFWEGVDVPGESLSALVIVRLPFTPPNHPIHEAKTERLKAQQKNPFMALSVPQAVIRFKQGFGRLIRTKKDRGVVIVFDRRIVDTRYGSAFIRSLPPVDIKYMPFTKIIDDIENRMT